MIGWLEPFVAHLKALHISMLAMWCAGLFAMPLMLARHDPAVAKMDYERIRRAAHYGYTFMITPAAITAIASGTILIFVREVFVAWMFAKLVFVALLVAFHAWLGYVLVAVVEETEVLHKTPDPRLPLVLLLVPILAILALVLAKPDLGFIPWPDWLLQPRGGQLPFDVPRR